MDAQQQQSVPDNDTGNRGPYPLYDLALNAAVNDMIAKATRKEPISKLPEMPISVLIDIHERMVQCVQLVMPLTVELSDLDVFYPMIRCAATRDRLLPIVAKLTSLPRRLSCAYVDRFSLPPRHKIKAPENDQMELLVAGFSNILNENQSVTHDGSAEGDGGDIDAAQGDEVEVGAAGDGAGIDGANNSKVDSDGAEGDGVKIDAAEGDGAKGYTSDGDGAQSDGAEIDGTEIDGAKGDDAESDETESDGAESDGAESDGAEGDSDNDESMVEEQDEFPAEDKVIIDMGLCLGSFLSEVGWMEESIAVLQCLKERLKRNFSHALLTRVNCLQHLIRAATFRGNFDLCMPTCRKIVKLISKMKRNKPRTVIVMAYTQCSAMFSALNDYDNSYALIVKAMHYLKMSLTKPVVIDVLRQAAKVFVVNRDYPRAHMLICQALRFARQHFGPKHPKYGDAILDYGFFLLNVAATTHCISPYMEALAVRRAIFGKTNFNVAMVHADLAYAYYVAGELFNASIHVETANQIVKTLTPNNNLVSFSVERVKGLLLQEATVDKIHLVPLQQSLQVCGEDIVQTARYYSNLGRLYQKMQRFEDSESMHLKAIDIKTRFLGPDHCEVGLSTSHLASLYYQMKRYREAEELYVRSISIRYSWFGATYSGVLDDVFGLCHVYESLNDNESYLYYADLLEEWQTALEQFCAHSSFPAIEENLTIDQILAKFLDGLPAPHDLDLTFDI